MNTDYVPLLVSVPSAGSVQPVTVGMPLPQGWLTAAQSVTLHDAAGTPVPLQTQALSHWHDGSVQWLLLDFLVAADVVGPQRWQLRRSPVPREQRTLAAVPPGVSFADSSGRTVALQPGVVETAGPIRVTQQWHGVSEGMRVSARWDTFAEPRLARLRVTLHNPRRAEHAGGLWDLGAAGSVFFSAFTLQLPVPAHQLIHCHLDQQPTVTANQRLHLTQYSSGGVHWNSRNHVNRAGQVPLKWRGYRLLADDRTLEGERATPIVQTGNVTVAVPEFWQQFPLALSVDNGILSVGLFPGDGDDLHELQGGEQKTRTVWFWTDEPTAHVPLRWVHDPATVQAEPTWVAATGVVWQFPTESPGEPLATLLDSALAGTNSLLARREVIDEYGWRNFGEVYADHEDAYFTGERPIISHYNNQYDMLFGFLQQYLLTGERRWWLLADPLARHVYDIDIYHTTADRAAYAGGPFWHTDHYRTAATATHRAYSRANAVPGQPYGGGPSNEHSYTTGLLYYFYLTGDSLAAAAVREVADWIVNMDDGRQTLLGLIDDGPTGLASQTRSPDYHGPGRGAGNAIHALLNAYLLTREQPYLAKAEELLQRCIHPLDDVAARDLLDLENSWSYTVFLLLLGRYLHLKEEWQQLDASYDYARRSLLHYATWMQAHERAYFDQRDKLEYPTETWPAQDLRKANVLRLAALYADEKQAQGFRERGDALATRAWADLLACSTRSCARPLAIVLSEGPREVWLRAAKPVPPAPRPVVAALAAPVPFVPQRQRIKRAVRSPGTWVRVLGRLLNVTRWPALYSLWRRGGW